MQIQRGKIKEKGIVGQKMREKKGKEIKGKKQENIQRIPLQQENKGKYEEKRKIKRE